MLRTIELGSTISVQGIFVKDMPDGKIAVHLDDVIYQGKPVQSLS